MKRILGNKKLLLIVVYATIAIVILFPIFIQNGHVFALDMLWFDRIKFLNYDQVYNERPFYIILQILDLLLPSSFIQRMILFLILFLSGTSACFLCKRFSKYDSVAFVCGLFYMINPFVYSRLAVGHWKFLLGYAVVPFYIISLLKLFGEKNRIRKGIKFYAPTGILPVSLLFTLISSISLHHVLLLLLFSLIPLCQVVFTKNKKQLFLKFLILNLSFLILNSYWLIPAALTKTQLSFISQEQLYYFSPSPDNRFGLTMNLLSLYGFWGEKAVINNLSRSSLGLIWPLLSLLLYLPAGVAVLKIWHRRRIRAISFLLIAIISFILAFGVGGAFYKIYIFLSQYVPGFAGFRDAQKFLSVFIICIVVLNAVGLDMVLKRLRASLSHGCMVGGFSLLIMILNFNFFSLVKSEWVISDYPKSWYEVREIIYDDPGSVEVLPKDTYLYLPFLKKHVANPAYGFLYKEGVIIYQYFELYEYTDCENPEKITRNCEIDEQLLSDEDLKYKFVVDSDEFDEIPDGWEVVLEDRETRTILLEKSI